MGHYSSPTGTKAYIIQQKDHSFYVLLGGGDDREQKQKNALCVVLLNTTQHELLHNVIMFQGVRNIIIIL